MPLGVSVCYLFRISSLSFSKCGSSSKGEATVFGFEPTLSVQAV